MSGLIRIQTVWHSYNIPERDFLKFNFEKKKKLAEDKKSWKFSQNATVKKKSPKNSKFA